MSEFEEVLDEIGSFGPFQVRVFLLVSAFETPAAWAMLISLFASSKSSWTCAFSSSNNDTNSTVFPSSSPYFVSGPGNSSAIFGNGTEDIDRCLPDNSPCQGHEYTAPFTSIVTEWDLICGQDYIGHLITTIQMMGVLIGALITGQLADTFGRRRVFFIVYMLLLLAGFIASFANSWQLYAVFRFFVGGFVGGTLLINFVLPLEFVGPKWRTFCGCIGFWACGVMTLALLAFFIRDWRILSLTTSVGGILLMFTWWFIPESPRWLVQKGRIDEATDILSQMARFNKRKIPNFDKLQVYASREMERRRQQEKYSYWDLCRNIYMTKNTFILTYAWFVSSAVYYGTSLNIGNLTGNKYINVFLSGLVEIPALIFVVLVNNRIGRRKTLCFLMLMAGVSMFAIFFVDLTGKLKTMPKLTTALALLGRCGIAGGWAAAQVYSAEVFPTVVRNIGVGACSMAARVGGVLAPQIVYLDKYSKPLPYVVFGCLATACGILSFALPETLNKPLPDTLPSTCWCGTRPEGQPFEEEQVALNSRDVIRDDKVHNEITSQSGSQEKVNHTERVML